MYASVVPVQPWAFTKFLTVAEVPDSFRNDLRVTENQISNRFYSVAFNKDGTLSVLNKELD